MCETFSSPSAIVELEMVHKSFSRGLLKKQWTKVLGPLSLVIWPGRTVGLFGPSGSGKTTLGNIALGLTKPDSGRVLWKGHRLETISSDIRHTLRPKFQKIFQDPVLSFAPFQTLVRSFQDYIRFLFPDKNKHDMAWKQINGLMNQMKLEPDLLKRTPDKVSGGEIQRLALIRCLLADPLFLVADEPTSRLDPLVQAQVARLIQSQALEKRMGLIFISHDFELLKALCHEVVRLEDGVLSRAWPTG